MSAIRHLAVSSDNDHFLSADFERRVDHWSLLARRKIGELNTILDFGGERLGISHGSQPTIFAANYQTGIWAYDPVSAQPVWKTSLRHIQQVAVFKTESLLSVGVGLEERCLILDGRTGEVKKETTSINRLYCSHYNSLLFGVSPNIGRLFGINFDPHWLYPMGKGAVLHCSFSPTSLAYALMNGPLVCLSLDGREQWSLHPPKAHHFLRVTWDQNSNEWLAIQWEFEEGTTKKLIRISSAGKMISESSLEPNAEFEFFPNGLFIAGSDGMIRSTKQVEDIVWRFRGQ